MSNLYANSQATTITASAAETIIVTADPNTENLLTSLVITLTAPATVGTLTLRDSVGGVVKAIYDFPSTAAVPNVPFWVAFEPPLKQSSKNSSWTIQGSQAITGHVNATFETEE